MVSSPSFFFQVSTLTSEKDQEEGNINYMMFSATFPKVCRDLAREHLAHEHVRIRVGRAGSSHANIKQVNLFNLPPNLSDLLIFQRMWFSLSLMRRDKLFWIFFSLLRLAEQSSLLTRSVRLMKLTISCSTSHSRVLPFMVSVLSASERMPFVPSVTESVPS